MAYFNAKAFNNSDDFERLADYSSSQDLPLLPYQPNFTPQDFPSGTPVLLLVRYTGLPCCSGSYNQTYSSLDDVPFGSGMVNSLSLSCFSSDSRSFIINPHAMNSSRY